MTNLLLGSPSKSRGAALYLWGQGADVYQVAGATYIRVDLLLLCDTACVLSLATKGYGRISVSERCIRVAPLYHAPLGVQTVRPAMATWDSGTLVRHLQGWQQCYAVPRPRSEVSVLKMGVYLPAG